MVPLDHSCRFPCCNVRFFPPSPFRASRAFLYRSKRHWRPPFPTLSAGRFSVMVDAVLPIFSIAVAPRSQSLTPANATTTVHSSASRSPQSRSSSRFAVGTSSPRRNDPAPDRSIVSSQRHVACDASVAAGLAQAFVCFPAKSSVRRSFRETLRVHPTLGRGGANASSVFFSVVWLWQHTIIAGPLIATPVFAV